MSYIGNLPTTGAFPFDQFTGNGTTTSFTLTYAPAGTTSIIVAISGVVQNPNNYSVIGQTLAFSPAPPAGANNISVLYLGLPVIGATLPGNTAFLSSTDLTATAGQKIFASAGAYTPGFVQVYRNGSRLGAADYVATNGTTVTLAIACAGGDLVAIEYYTLNALVNALPMTGGVVTGSTTFNSDVTINGALASGVTGFKNRIINGDMRIDQRNAGAAVSIGAGTFITDRFTSYKSNGGAVTGQQVTVTNATGFTKALLITVSTVDSVVDANDVLDVSQAIEGSNITDFDWGTSAAVPITISFRVRSSIPGVYCLAIRNATASHCYVMEYTINAANTFETKVLTIPGATIGVWGTGTGVGLNLNWTLQGGSTFQVPVNSWNAASNKFVTFNQTNFMSTAGATFYITGVQLEKGPNATSFEYRDYGRELAMCQRYYEKSFSIAIAPANGPDTTSFSTSAGVIKGIATNRLGGTGTWYSFKVIKRSTPTISSFGNSSGFPAWLASNGTALTFSSSLNIGAGATDSGFEFGQQVVDGTFLAVLGHYTASAEL